LTGEPTDLVMANYSRTHVVVEEEENQGTLGSNEKWAGSSRPSVSLFTFKLLVLAILAGLAATLAYFWISGRLTRANPTRLEAPSIAVLPFKMIGAEDDNEFLGLGMADALITRLGNIRAVAVRPTSAVRRYVDMEQNPVAIGQRLGVEYILEGSIQRSNDRIRVSVQLLGVRDGAPIWAENFDERFTGVFAVQDSISIQVARALKPELTGEERKLLAKRYTENPEAYRAYLKGRYLASKRTIEDLQRSIGYFEQAIQIDPNFALAFAGLADSYTLLEIYLAVPTKDVIPQAKAAAMRALELDDTLAEAHTSLGYILCRIDWDWSGSEREFKRAIELNPNYASAHHWYSLHLMFTRRFDEAMAELKRAQELDPLSLPINTAMGAVFYRARRYDDAIEHFQRTMKLYSDSASGGLRIHLGQAYEQKGMYEQAVEEFQRARDLSGNGSDALAQLAHAYGASGKRTEALNVLSRLNELSKQRYVPSHLMALVYAGLGEKDQALSELQKAYEERSSGLVEVQVDPRFDSLRADPRFADLVHRMGLAL
jgi:TolB-like protein/tetratricopeptide (TPR) repeat protein